MKGLIVQAKYCFMPNRLGACGAQNKKEDLFEYAVCGAEDTGLEEILKTFEAAYPYLKFIAEANGIANPFEEKVVRAYWLGNSLLDFVDKQKFYHWCFERYGKMVDKKIIKLLVGKVPLGAVPHHSFHVFNSYLRQRNYSKVLHYINECRVSSGKVVKLDRSSATVEWTPIKLGVRGLSFGETEKRDVLFKFQDKSFVKDLTPGDIVSFHWGWAAERISPQQEKDLSFYTRKQLDLFNEPPT